MRNSISTPLLAASGAGVAGNSSAPSGGRPRMPLGGFTHRLCESNKRHRLSLERKNVGTGSQLTMYLGDIFHTMVNMPGYRFVLVFLVSYILMWMAFATAYMTQPVGCIYNTTRWAHTLWFSVISSATIGFGYQSPDPDCYATNIILMAQAVLLGVVYARFSMPSRHSVSIRFSRVMSMYQGEDGSRRLAFRVANMRNHQVLQPQVRMLLVHFERWGGKYEYVYTDLEVKHIGGGNLWLGVPSIMAHTIDHSSPLYTMTREQLASLDAEIVVLLDGIDESTATTIQARHSYFPSDIKWQARFEPVLSRFPSGRMGIDFSAFDLTAMDRPASEGGTEAGAELATESDLESGLAEPLGGAGDGAHMAASIAEGQPPHGAFFHVPATAGQHGGLAALAHMHPHTPPHHGILHHVSAVPAGADDDAAALQFPLLSWQVAGEPQPTSPGMPPSPFSSETTLPVGVDVADEEQAVRPALAQAVTPIAAALPQSSLLSSLASSRRSSGEPRPAGGSAGSRPPSRQHHRVRWESS
eukprot:scaffold5.g1013.t1